MELGKKYKIKILSPEHSKQVQNYAFSIGFKWWRNNDIAHTDRKYLYFKNHSIFFGSEEETFIKQESEEIFFPLSIHIQYEVY